MKIKLFQLGKTKADYIQQGIRIYEQRLRNYIVFEIETIESVKSIPGQQKEQIRQKEGELILSKLKPEDRLVLLDEKGKGFSSTGFADFVQKRMNEGHKNLVFLIGGAYGFSEAVYNRSDWKISLSEMTFSHQLVRLVFLEQLYRAFTILNNHPYHHE